MLFPRISLLSRIWKRGSQPIRTRTAPRFRLGVEGLETRDVPAIMMSASLSNSSVQVGQPVSISGSVSTTNPMSYLGVSYLWGDGLSSSSGTAYSPGSTPSMPSPIYASHAYTTTGSYTISVTATATYSPGVTESAFTSFLVNVTPTSPMSPPPMSPPPMSPPPMSPPPLSPPPMSPPPTPAGTGTGLFGRYYNTQNLTEVKTARVDPTVNFDWGQAAPAGTTVGADNFSVRWSGKVEPRYSGEYTFHLTADDGVRLWVNGVQIVDKWDGAPNMPWQGAITLQAGQKYDIKLEYLEKTVAAAVKLEWSSAQQIKEVIPTTQLYPNVLGEGTGLLGTYYKTPYLTPPSLTSPPIIQVDATVNFNWGITSPFGTGEIADNFSIRWSGKIQPLSTGMHTFYTNTDDGVRLWVNGQQIINDWIEHPATQQTSFPIQLQAGELYDIQMEYFDHIGGAIAQLSWSYPGQTMQIIPTFQLYPSSASPVYYASGNGLLATYTWAEGQNATSRTRNDTQGVNFDWGPNSPSDATITVPADNFSVRWTGFVQPQYTERYQFRAFTDDGVIVWVNGVRVVNDYSSHTARESGPFEEIDLIAGQRYAITMQYFEGVGDAVAKLFWSSPSQAKEVIPSNRLYPAVPAARVFQGPAGQGGEIPTGYQELRSLVTPPDKATILTGIPRWRQSGGEVLALPGDVQPYRVGTDLYWTGVVPGGAFVGPSGSAPCVGVALIPSDRTQPTFVLHFSSLAVIPDGFRSSGFAINATEVRQGYRAVLCGAAKPFGDPANAEVREQNSNRLYTLQDVVSFLQFHNVPITAYLPTSGFAVDANGWVYWSESPGSPDEVLRYEQ